MKAEFEFKMVVLEQEQATSATMLIRKQSRHKNHLKELEKYDRRESGATKKDVEELTNCLQRKNWFDSLASPEIPKMLENVNIKIEISRIVWDERKENTWPMRRGRKNIVGENVRIFEKNTLQSGIWSILCKPFFDSLFHIFGNLGVNLDKPIG